MQLASRPLAENPIYDAPVSVKVSPVLSSSTIWNPLACTSPASNSFAAPIRLAKPATTLMAAGCVAADHDDEFGVCGCEIAADRALRSGHVHVARVRVREDAGRSGRKRNSRCSGLCETPDCRVVPARPTTGLDDDRPRRSDLL